MNKKGQQKFIFVLFYAFFLAFTLFMIAASPLKDTVQTSANMTLEAPVCVIEGWDVLFDVVACAGGYIGFFVSFLGLTTAEGYGWVWLLVFSPMLVTFGWIILEVLRGT